MNYLMTAPLEDVMALIFGLAGVLTFAYLIVFGAGGVVEVLKARAPKNLMDRCRSVR